MSIVVGHDIDPGMLPYGIGLWEQQQMNAARNAAINVAGTRTAPGDVSGGMGFHANLGQGNLAALRAAKEHAGLSTPAGFDWQEPIKVYNPNGSNYDSENMTGGGGAHYDLAYRSMGVDPLANAAGVAGADPGFGKLGSIERTVKDEGIEDPFNPGQRKYIDVNDAGERNALFGALTKEGFGNQSIDGGDYAKLFLSPEEQAQRQGNIKFGNSMRQYGAQQDAQEQRAMRMEGQKEDFRTQESDKNRALRSQEHEKSLNARAFENQAKRDAADGIFERKRQMAEGKDRGAAEGLMNDINSRYDAMDDATRAEFDRQFGPQMAEANAISRGKTELSDEAVSEYVAHNAKALWKGLNEFSKTQERRSAAQERRDFQDQQRQESESGRNNRFDRNYDQRERFHGEARDDRKSAREDRFMPQWMLKMAEQELRQNQTQVPTLDDITKYARDNQTRFQRGAPPTAQGSNDQSALDIPVPPEHVENVADLYREAKAQGMSLDEAHDYVAQQMGVA